MNFAISASVLPLASLYSRASEGHNNVRILTSEQRGGIPEVWNTQLTLRANPNNDPNLKPSLDTRDRIHSFGLRL